MKKTLKSFAMISMLLSLGYGVLSCDKDKNESTTNSLLVVDGTGSDNKVVASDGTTDTEYTLKDFHSINVSHTFSIKVISSSQYKITVTHSDNLKDHLKLDNSDSILSLGLSPGTYSNAKLSAVIHLPTLKGLEASGSSSIEVPEFNTNNMEINISGTSTLSGKLSIKNKLEADVSGGSTVQLEGSTQSATMDVSGVSKFEGKNFIISGALKLDCSGASQVSLKANGSISSDVTGGGNFKNYGSGN